MRAHFFEDGMTRLNSHLLIRRRNYALEPAQILFEAFLDAHYIPLKTELRAAQPNFHRRQSRRLKVAARSLSVARQQSSK